MASEPWQRNLYAIFVAQLLVIMGFSFVTPFLPLFIQQLGTFTNKEAAFWAGIATSAHGLIMFLSAPLWGILADRYGRKPMVLRAQFGSALALAATGLAPNVLSVVGFRAVQGFFSGTVAAASALVAASTPRDKMPLAMGLLMAAVFGGSTLGPLFGGIMADNLGYKATFYITGGILFVGGLIVLFLVRENFQRPEKGQGASLANVLRLARSRQMLPLLMALGALHMGPRIIEPVIPVFIRQIDPEGATATASGLAFSLMGVLAAISSVAASRLGRRMTLKKMLFFSCLGASLCYLPPMWAGTVAQLVIFVALTGLFKGGLMTSSSALVGLSVSRTQQGIAFGVAQSANALGNGLGPLIGGVLAPLLGLRSVFGIGAALFILVGVLVARLLTETHPDKDQRWPESRG